MNMSKKPSPSSHRSQGQVQVMGLHGLELQDQLDRGRLGERGPHSLLVGEGSLKAPALGQQRDLIRPEGPGLYRQGAAGGIKGSECKCRAAPRRRYVRNRPLIP